MVCRSLASFITHLRCHQRHGYHPWNVRLGVESWKWSYSVTSWLPLCMCTYYIYNYMRTNIEMQSIHTKKKKMRKLSSNSRQFSKPFLFILSANKISRWKTAKIFRRCEIHYAKMNSDYLSDILRLIPCKLHHTKFTE